jgi:hypothetical protein
MSKNSIFALGILGLLISLTCGAFGCGKKGWPEPILDKERFVWSEISTTVQGQCLDITALLNGNVQNLTRLTLEVEMRPKPCPGCPFSPTTTVRMDSGSELWERRGALVHVQWCGLEQDMAIRWRLIGHSLHTNLADVPSRVYSLQPEK